MIDRLRVVTLMAQMTLVGLSGLAADARQLEQLLESTTSPAEDPLLLRARGQVLQRLQGVVDVVQAWPATAAGLQGGAG